MESAGDFEPASDGGRLDSRLFGIQGLGALLMGPMEECRHGGVPSQRGGLAWSGGGRVGGYERGALCPC